MKRVFYFSPLLLILFFLSACSGNSKADLIGKWEQSVNENGIKIVSTYEFKDNGEMYQTVSMSGEGISLECDGHSKYTFEDNTITFKFSGNDFNFTKIEIAGLPPEMVKAQAEQIKSTMVDVEQKITDIKIDGNTLTGTFNGRKITLTRL